MSESTDTIYAMLQGRVVSAKQVLASELSTGTSDTRAEAISALIAAHIDANSYRQINHNLQYPAFGPKL